ncbi:CHAT domain-containing protein [uncultured Roseobacter sp.]|uniref:CHAT domain-containing protein n=1 Tax=uncultured Roseobacter sp. TaxID=114847 RepID=UPI002628F5F6|nr:CHAT domain-containing protein [uncultured Roseobacter sp.]
MTTKVLVPGQARGPGSKSANDLLSAGSASVEIVLGGSRGADGSVEAMDVPDEHLIEVELDNGMVLFRRLDTLEGMEESASRSDSDLALLPTHIELQGNASRGEGRGLAVRLYRFFTGDAVVKATVESAARAVEGKLESNGVDVLFRLGRDGSFTPADGLSDGQKMAVFIHGTFSSTAGSFGNLIPTAGEPGTDTKVEQKHWSMLADAFADTADTAATHIYAFEHCTLTKSPVQNAIALLKALPRSAELTLLSHSRGGLVGDLIARAGRVSGEAFDERDLGILESARQKAGDATPAEIEAEKADLKELSRLIADRRPRIDRFVRVASPARGTILASDRLDRGLSVIFNLMRLIPGPQRYLLEPVRQLAQSVAAQRADSTVLPGLEAMRPQSPLVALLNRPDVSVDGPLAIVAGDTVPRGVLRGLAIFATDLFYREDHDIVVETTSMSAGVQRAGPLHRLMASGPDIDHFSYFRSAETASHIVRALLGDAEEAGFRPLNAPDDPERMPATSSRGTTVRSLGERPVAILLPGIQGSQLGEANGNIVWLDLLEMGLGGIRKIGARGGTPTPDVRSVRSIPRYYGSLLRNLGQSHDVIDFHYDWRQSINIEADRLAKTVTQVLDATTSKSQPIRLIGHSMGGLVVRAMIKRHRAVWDRMFDGRKGSRFVMLGTPNGGSAAMAWALLGRDKMIKLLETVDVFTSMPQLLKEIQPMPGALELLPTDVGGQFFDAETWKAWNVDGYPLPEQVALSAAQTTVAALKLRSQDRQRMVYLAGKADATPVAIEVVGRGRKRRLRLLATRNGDGRVPWRTGILPGIRSWFAPSTQHGDLCRDERLFPAIHDLVVRGQTTLLSQTPPTARGGDRLIEMPPEKPIYPTEEELQAAALGADVRRFDAVSAGAPVAKIGIRHGDLRSHNGIIALGHYRDTPLLSAEMALDQMLDRKLLRHRDLGLYPGSINSAEVFLRSTSGDGPDGALVMGLGIFGELSKARLISTLTHGLLRYALHPDRVRTEGGCKITTLLIGHRDSRLSTRDCVVSLLEALRGANRDLPETHRIREVEILELYEDVAIAVAESLDTERASHSWDEDIQIGSVVRTGVAGRRRAHRSDNTAWDQKIRITLDAESASRFRYEALSQSALVSQADVTIDRATIDGYVRGETQSTRATTNAGKLLFEWMVPRSMKAMAADGRPLTLMLDATTAGYPWELMEDHFDNRDSLIAVDAGVMRQFVDRPSPDRPPLARTDRVCVIGDPDSYFNKLKAAATEAASVRDKFLMAGWSNDDVQTTINDTSRIDELLDLSRNRVLHFAGHGVHNWGPDKLTGLVIGKNRIFGPDRVKQLRFAPEFVFLNCCHVGNAYDSISPETAADANGKSAPHQARDMRAELAANMAFSFISLGSKAVIAAGWEVDDKAAEAFADAFYTSFLEGQIFSEAVRAGREAAYRSSPGKNTWGAYQCYGDPQFRLRRSSLPVDVRTSGKHFKTAGQVTSVLQSLRADTRYAATQEARDELQLRLSKVERLVDSKPDWQDEPELLEAMGRCSAQLGNSSDAIRRFESALKCSRPGYSQEMVDRLWELRTRVATATRIVAEQKSGGGARELRAVEKDTLKKMEAHLATSLSLAGVSGAWRRHVRLGDTHLRLASVLTGAAKSAMIEKAYASYVQAEMATQERNTNATGHARIRLAFAAFLKDGAATLTEDGASVIKSILADIKDTTDASPTFENARLRAEAQLFDLLDDGGDTEGHQAMLVETFNNMFISGASPGQRQETLGDLQTVAALLRGRVPSVANQIERIIGDLVGTGGTPVKNASTRSESTEREEKEKI